MATYYIDYVSGSDSWDGLYTVFSSPNHGPWKHCPGDPAATASANITLSPGDQCIFKGGVTYVGHVVPNNSGNADTLAGRIHFDGDSGTYVSRWGSGTDKADFDANEAIGFDVGNRSYLTINGIELHNGPTAAGDELQTDRSLIFGAAGSSYITVSNNTIHDVGRKVSISDYTGQGIGSDGCHHWKIHGNVFYNCYSCAIIFNPTYASHVGKGELEIYENTFTDIIGWAISIVWGLTAGPMSGFYIHDNLIYNLKWYSENGWDNPHVNYIWCYTNSDPGCDVDEIYVYNNFIYNDGTSYESSGSIHFEITDRGDIQHLYIYGNVIKNTWYIGQIYITIQGAGNYDNIYVLNNSIHGVGSSIGGVIFHSKMGTGHYGKIDIRNNIFEVNASWAFAISFEETAKQDGPITIDYNLYYAPGNSTPFMWNDVAVSWAAFKAGTGQPETHSIGTTTDPMFTDDSANAHDLRLASDESPAYNAGVDLSGLGLTALGTDLDGVSRPQGAAWDMGAYEYGGGEEPPTSAPVGVAVVMGW